MRILLAHNRYQQAGGEDIVFETERDLLQQAGVLVGTLEVSNKKISGGMEVVSTALGTTYSLSGRELMRQALRDTKPDIVHVHNFFPLLSPSIFDACADAGVPTVWTLHNYRIACANGLLLYQGKPCEECVGRLPWRAVQRACYRGSTVGSAVVAGMIGFHERAGTWKDKVAKYIALTQFSRTIFLRSGLPPHRVTVKPNIISDSAVSTSSSSRREGYLYVGRLSVEKGIATLLDAWRGLDVPLTIIGDGPIAKTVREAAATNQAIRYLGPRPRPFVLAAMANAKVLVVPSIGYENFPLTTGEAMMMGLPVIASRCGVFPEIVRDGQTGLLFSAGDADALRRCVANIEHASQARLDEFGLNARQYWESALSPKVGLDALLKIYRGALEDRAASD